MIIMKKRDNEIDLFLPTKYKNKDGVVHDHVYWACSSKVTNIKGTCDNSVTIRDEELKSLFVALFNKFLNQSRNDDLINKITEEIKNGSSLEVDNMANIHKILTVEDVRDVKLKESSSFHVPTYKIEALTSESESDVDYFTLMTIGTDHTIWFGSGDNYEVKEKDNILLERIENVMNQE